MKRLEHWANTLSRRVFGRGCWVCKGLLSKCSIPGVLQHWVPDGLSADGLIACQRLRSTFSVFLNAFIWWELHWKKQGTYLEHYCSWFQDGSYPLNEQDVCRAREERAGQCQCWCSCYSGVELPGNHKGGAKQMPLREQRWWERHDKAENFQGI